MPKIPNLSGLDSESQLTRCLLLDLDLEISAECRLATTAGFFLIYVTEAPIERAFLH